MRNLIKRIEIILLILFVASFLVSCDATYIKNEDKVLYNSAYGKLKAIQLAINMYKEDYNEYPAKLDLLISDYLPDDKQIFICPASIKKYTDKESVFVYNTAVHPYWLLRTPKPLYKDIYSKPSNGNLGYIVLFPNGKIMWNEGVSPSK